MDGFNEKKWFVYLTDHHEGPFSLSEIQAKMEQSQLTTANYVWAEGMTDWKPMTSIPEFESVLSASTQAVAAPALVSVGADTGGGTMVMAAPNQPEVTLDASAVEITNGGDDAGETAQPMTPSEPAGSPEPAELKIATFDQRPAPHAASNIPIEDRRSNSRSEPDAPQRSVGRLIKWALIILIPAGVASAYINGNLDPLLNAPAVKAGTRAAAEMSQPYLLKLAEKVPALSQWISPIPSLEDVTPDDYEMLKAAALQKPEEGAKIAVAVSSADIFSPTFYVSSNLPNGAVIDVYVEGISDTLLNQLSFSGKVQATITKKLGKTGAIRFPDGKPLPRGDYVIYATENAQQPDAVKTLLASIPPVTAKVAANLPRGLKLLVSRPAFLGGIKDATYASRLKEFHDKLRAKASGEIAEIKQFEGLLESQLTLTNSKYTQLRGLVRKGKPSFAAHKSWSDFNSQWSKLDAQLKDSYGKWTEQVLATEYFYGMLYSLTKSAGEAVEKLQQLHSDFFDGKKDFKTLEIERGSAVSVASSAVSALKNKIAQAESLAPTPNGMPRREGL